MGDGFCYACVKGRSEAEGNLTARAAWSCPDAVSETFSLGSEKCERFTGFPCRAGSYDYMLLVIAVGEGCPFLCNGRDNRKLLDFTHLSISRQTRSAFPLKFRTSIRYRLNLFGREAC